MLNFLRKIWADLFPKEIAIPPTDESLPPITFTEINNVVWEKEPIKTYNFSNTNITSFQIIPLYLPTKEMIENAQLALKLMEVHKKGGENHEVLKMGINISNGAVAGLSDKDILFLRKEMGKRKRFANARADTMGYINFNLLGGNATLEWLECLRNNG